MWFTIYIKAQEIEAHNSESPNTWGNKPPWVRMIRNKNNSKTQRNSDIKILDEEYKVVLHKLFEEIKLGITEAGSKRLWSSYQMNLSKNQIQLLEMKYIGTGDFMNGWTSRLGQHKRKVSKLKKKYEEKKTQNYTQGDIEMETLKNMQNS